MSENFNEKYTYTNGQTHEPTDNTHKATDKTPHTHPSHPRVGGWVVLSSRPKKKDVGVGGENPYLLLEVKNKKLRSELSFT
jgi:hypothetical protein